MKIRIYYEDTDAGGIVYHTNYIKFCERARSEAFFSANMMPFDSDNSGFIAKDLKCSFLSTAKLGDLVNVTTEVLPTEALNNRKIFKMILKITMI